MKKLLLASFLFHVFIFHSNACNTNESEIIVSILPDNYPQEISWELKDNNNNTLAFGGSVGDTLCIPTSTCLTFTIFDSFGDGICCVYGAGSYSIYSDGNLIATGGDYTNQESTTFNCPPGESCRSAITVSTGIYTAPDSDIWYSFQPSQAGIYEITTCFASNTCDTKLWVYDHCNNLTIDNTNVGTILYDDNAGGCGLQAVITAALDPAVTYYIRVGSNNGACGSSPIEWALNYSGPVVGCMDPNACNYNPLATVSSGTCYYWPDANCPGGPDLTIIQTALENSMYIDQINATNCQVQENCLTGYGMRTVIRFTTHIKNIGDVDYYIGNPTNNPTQFSFTNCHNHPHYEGYAEYVLYKNNGQSIPIGFKNGFCVIDLECSGGGTAQYGCSNMGITAGCGDIYSAGLECQWIDITDVDPGDYILAVKVNWDQSPDALGRQELDYLNNWAQVCVTIYIDGLGNKNFVIDNNCPPYTDCAGTPYGNVTLDCNGVCGGSTLMGDLDIDMDRDTTDSQNYINGILSSSLSPNTCNDLNNDAILSVWDAALAQQCFYHSTPYNSACVFPHGVTNTNMTATLSVDTVNMSMNYIDVSILNPDNKILGYEFNVSGIEILDVVPLYNTTNYSVDPQFLVGGTKVIGLSLVDSLLPKNTTETPFVRIFFSAVTDTIVCLSEIVHIVNPNYEAVNTQISNGCRQVSSASVAEMDISNYLLIWPNPANDLVNLEINTDGENADLTINNSLGETVFVRSITSSTNRLTIDVSEFSSGIYQITLKTKKGNTVQKLIVNK